VIKIKEAILVEGRYDKNTLSQIVDAPIFESDGFGIFKNREQMSLLRQVAQKRGLVVFTDSDGAGFVIRNHVKSAIDNRYLKHAYIPDVYGKERRKAAPGKEGKIGVEGMTKDVLLDALKRAGATFNETVTTAARNITKQDFVELGLSGGQDSSEKRRQLLQKLGMPEKMSSNAMLQAVNLLYSKEELVKLMEE
jgi:ribonuclease M5